MRWIIHRPDEWPHIDYFVNPLPALAIAGMALNDHVLKHQWPSWITGKLSDFLGMFYFPLFLCACVCLAANYILRWPKRKGRVAYINERLMWMSMATSALLLASVKLSPAAASVLETFVSRFFVLTKITRDPTDLIALATLPASYLYARRFFGSTPRAPHF